ncbi:esterase lipase thioesterase family protein [Favolaschia claudopus]|uniref:Esterase lipase thioesterase family protein n=1 Tax=Favolaschia claudopus TaxID=2862362 RepID=A0AAW0C212_9AGAR
MDIVAQMKETGITAVFFPSESLSAFSFQYGSTTRHQLDIYYPSDMGQQHPILFYVYGGFVHGQRNRPAPADLMYGNLGSYFSSRGFVTIIPDYRLAPETTYPGPALDLRDALAWAISHPDVLGPGADIHSIFLLGHSSGAMHILTFFLEPSIHTAKIHPHIKGAIIASALFNVDSEDMDERLRQHVNAYYVSQEAAAMQSPLALLRQAPNTALPDISLIICAHDPGWLKLDLLKSYGILRRRLVKLHGKEPKIIRAEGHNHISLPLALGTGQGEDWAEEAIAWMGALGA